MRLATSWLRHRGFRDSLGLLVQIKPESCLLISKLLFLMT